MPLLCAVALVQSMRRETVWHLSREGDYCLPESGYSRPPRSHLGPAPHRFVTFSIVTNLIVRQLHPDFSYDDIPPSTFTFS